MVDQSLAMVVYNDKQKKKKRKHDKAVEADVDDSTRKQFSSADYGLLVEWLEVPENLEAITGSKGKTKVGARYRTKKQAFSSMAAFINERQLKGSKLASIDGDGARNRWLLLEKKYKQAKPIVEGTGWGLTAADEANHILTIDAKLDLLCPCYKRLDGIFGTDPNVNFMENNYSTVVPVPDSVDNMPWTEPFSELLAGTTDESPEILLHSVHEEEVCFHDDLESRHDTTESIPTTPMPTTDMPVPDGTPTAHSLNSDGVNVDETIDDATKRTCAHEKWPRKCKKGDKGSGSKGPLKKKNSTPEGTPTAHSLNSEGVNVDETVEEATEATERTQEPKKSKKGDQGSGSTGPFKNKKSTEKGLGIASSFASGLEAISEAKIHSNVLKERGQDMVFKAMESDRDLRADTSQKQLDFQVSSAERQYNLEVEKLRVAEKRIVADSRRDLMQAKVSIVNSNSNLSATQIAELLKMLFDPEG